MSVYTYRRGSIFWSLTLIAVGVIFLWQNFDPTVRPWQLIAKFWPILIIFWGLSKLIDYVQAQAHPETTPPPLFSGSEVVMLVLILVMGTIVSKVVLHPVREWGWHFDDDEISNIFLNSYTYDRTFSQPLKAGSQLVLDDQRGPVTIQGADQTAIDVTAKESIRADDESAAKNMSDRLKIEVVEEAGRYLLRTNRRSLPDDGGRVTLDLNLRVPKATSSQITSERGDIQVDGLVGDETLFTQHGDVRATNTQGLVKIHKAGSSTEVRGVKGSVELEGRGDDIEIADVSDTVTVHGEYSGSIQFRNIGQTLRFESQRTDMTAQKLSGRLDMEIGSLDINGIDGPFDITTHQKDITVNEFKHSLHITNSNGQITLQTSTPPTHDILVDSKNGAVEVTLPPSSNFQIEANSRHGEVECDFTGPGLKIAKEGNTPSISGTIGKGGPMIRISTDYGSIRVLRAGSQPAKPPSPPEPPAAPGKVQTTFYHPRQHYTYVARLHRISPPPARKRCVHGCAN
jgi:DUF4097 and DUF4098 domain-containing protein YvlB